MYLEYFGLTEAPFSIAPDPRYLYMSERHREALAHLVYGLNSDGAFILLTGDVGTGKTTVSRCLLEQIPDNTRLALVLNPKVSACELLQTICDELRIGYDRENASIKDYVDLINRFLLGGHAQGKKTVVMIEEAQNLDLDVLEQLRLLTNLETNDRKLLQIILLGQPEFLDVLNRPELSQLSQRITARYHLKPLNYEEMLSYVSYRLSIAGCRQVLFKKAVLKRLHKASRGIPRIINLICDRSLLGCYVQSKAQIDRETLDNAAKEVLGKNGLNKKSASKKSFNPIWIFGPVVAALVIVLIGVQFYLHAQNKTQNTHQIVELEKPKQINSAKKNKPEKELAKKPVTKIAEEYQKAIWPNNIERLRSNTVAFQNLFSHWKMEYDPLKNGSACFYAQTKKLSCWHGTGDILEIGELNRPAILRLRDEEGQIHYAALTAIKGEQITLVLAEKKQIWSLDQLVQYWTGDFTLLWKQPPGYSETIHPGHKGKDVLWLSQKINQLDQNNKIPEASIYKKKLVEKIRQFQTSQGLEADGVVGVQTLIRLNNLTGLDVPMLKNNG